MKKKKFKIHIFNPSTKSWQEYPAIFINRESAERFCWMLKNKDLKFKIIEKELGGE